MTQIDLARRIGLDSQGHISRMEAGKKSPSLRLVLSIAGVFEVMTDYLICDDIALNAWHACATTRAPVCQEPLSQLFGKKLHYLRTKDNLSQTELARHLGLSAHTHISFLESHRKEPSIDLVRQLATYFNVTTDYLLRDEVAVEWSDASEE
ncbi:MAG: transcriptional regulator [Chloroflexaceae bacterium]|nr:transcriptional regulator [Chloroflexaceae bacterium]